MSWLARSIANSLLIDEDEDDRPTTSPKKDRNNDHQRSPIEQEFEGSDSQTLTGGVKEDLSEFTESVARQIWGVASFLAPPPPPPPPPPLRHRSSTTTTQPDPSISRDDNDSNSPTFLNDDQQQKDKAYVGATEEVLAFATNIAHHPETWLDFPLSEEEDSDDFQMSDTQWNHATLVEHLVPRLAALRIELCPIHMSESYFWKVYFLLLHPRLNKHDAHLLSTPQIVAARTMWMKVLQMKTRPEPDLYQGNTSHEDIIATSAFEPTTYHTVLESDEVEVTKEEGESEQRVIPSFTMPTEEFDDDEDNWIHENSELDGYEWPDAVVGDDEDISFSDLEDFECDIKPIERNCK